MDQPRDDGGKYTGQVSDSDVLRALRSHSDPVATAKDLAEILEVSAETARRHLSSLHEAGAVERKEVGARAVVWWPAERPDDEDDTRSDPVVAGRGFFASGDDTEVDVDEELYGDSPV